MRSSPAGSPSPAAIPRPTPAAAHAAFDRGATAVTHLFNAMRRPEHRDPGIAYAALGRDDVWITLIVDGNHLADDTVRAAAAPPATGSS